MRRSGHSPFFRLEQAHGASVSASGLGSDAWQTRRYTRDPYPWEWR